MKKNYFYILLLVFVVFGIFTTENTIAQSLSDQLLAYNLPIRTYLWGLATTLAQIATWVLFSGYALQTTISNPQWISVTNPFVQTGLGITTAVADILLIAVFVAIAIGYVFKIDTFNSQKILPKFFIGALLVHFGPLFVGMVIDISNIAMQSLMIGDDSTIMDACRQFAQGIFSSELSIIRKYAQDVIFAAIAVIAPVKGVTGILGFLANNGWMLLQLPVIMVQIMIGQIFSGIMFSYAIFFLTRVFMMQILAILSPLAILASVLPQTKNLFSTWLKWLIGWATAGIMTMFLLTLGLSTLKTLLPTITDNSINLTGGYSLFLRPDAIYWLMICIYMLTVEAIVAGTIPAISGTVEKKITGGQATKGLLNISTKKKDTLSQLAEEVAAKNAAAAGSTPAEEVAQRNTPAPTEPTTPGTP
jgi:hypothetical protein